MEPAPSITRIRNWWLAALLNRESIYSSRRRNIEPQIGKWTLPAGYMENNETAIQGALRETFEESGAEVKLGVYRLFDLPAISQLYLLFRAKLPSCLSRLLKKVQRYSSSSKRIYPGRKLPSRLSLQLSGTTVKILSKAFFLLRTMSLTGCKYLG